MTSPWKAVLGVILIFVLGAASGWLARSLLAYHQATQFLQRGPEAVAEVLERRTTRNLGLDANQQQQIHSYFMENVKQRRALQLQIQPEVQILNRTTLEQIMAVLRPDQRPRFRENLVEFRQRFGKSALNPNTENQPGNVPPAPLGNQPPPP